MHIYTPHEVDQGGDVGHHCMIPGKYLCSGGALPREPVSILLRQVSCSTHIEDVLVEPAGHEIDGHGHTTGMSNIVRVHVCIFMCSWR